jgi:ATP-dependent Clp protease protease subunit
MKRLVNLILQNKDNPARAIRAEANTVYFYDVIGYEEEGTAEIVKQIRGMSGDITLRINSPGGDVFAARAIASALRETGQKVTAYIDGWAASAATTIAMAADEIYIAEGGFFMIHNSMTMAWGNKEELLSAASLLEKIDHAIAADYSRKTKKDTEQIKAWMDAETWFSADEAVEHGFVDGKTEIKNTTKWNLAAYDNAPAVPEPAPKVDDEARHKELCERRFSLIARCPA